MYQPWLTTTDCPGNDARQPHRFVKFWQFGRLVEESNIPVVCLRKFDWTCPSQNVQLNIVRDVNARRSGFQSNLSIGTFSSAPFPRSEAYRAKGNPMRTLVEPPPSSHCDVCGGELRLKQIESANRALDLDNEIFVCVKCHREQSCTVRHNHNVRYMPDPKAA
jgi:hypothetical protein